MYFKSDRTQMVTFTSEHLQASEWRKSKLGDLYLYYRAWCVENKVLPTLKKSSFAMWLEILGFDRAQWGREGKVSKVRYCCVLKDPERYSGFVPCTREEERLRRRVEHDEVLRLREEQGDQRKLSTYMKNLLKRKLPGSRESKG